MKLHLGGIPNITPWQLPTQNSLYRFNSDHMPLRHSAVTTHSIIGALVAAFGWLATIAFFIIMVPIGIVILTLTL